MRDNRQRNNPKQEAQNSAAIKSGATVTQQTLTSSTMVLMQQTFGNQDLNRFSEQFEQTNEDKMNKDSEQQIVIAGVTTEKNTVIKSASDLLIWLVSHPINSNETPKSFAEIPLLKDLLNELWKKKEEIQPHEVWETLRDVIQKKKDTDEYEAVEEEEDNELSWDDDKLEVVESGEVDDEVSWDIDELDTVELGEEDNKVNWDDGDWVEKEEYGIISKEPARYRRKMPSKEYKKAKKQLADKLTGYKLVGIHATRIESMGSLVKEGVSEGRFNTNHGVGKGIGFYIIPTSGSVNKSISGAAKLWGNHYVAVYLPEECILQHAVSGENVETLEKDKSDGEQCYYSFADMEAVIPPSLCKKIILVCDPADISMADPSFEAEVDASEPFEFLNALPNQVKSSRNKK